MTARDSTFKRAVDASQGVWLSGNRRRLRRKHLRMLYVAMRRVTPPYRTGIVQAAVCLRKGGRASRR